MIQAEAHEEANIIFGTVIDEGMGDEIRITIIATGFDDNGKKKQINTTRFEGHKNFSIPTYLRQEKLIDDFNAVKVDMADDEDNPDLEIPTFLRRQAD